MGRCGDLVHGHPPCQVLAGVSPTQGCPEGSSYARHPQALSSATTWTKEVPPLKWDPEAQRILTRQAWAHGLISFVPPVSCAAAPLLETRRPD